MAIELKFTWTGPRQPGPWVMRNVNGIEQTMTRARRIIVTVLVWLFVAIFLILGWFLFRDLPPTRHGAAKLLGIVVALLIAGFCAERVHVLIYGSGDRPRRHGSKIGKFVAIATGVVWLLALVFLAALHSAMPALSLYAPWAFGAISFIALVVMVGCVSDSEGGEELTRSMNPSNGTPKNRDHAV